MPWAFDLGFQTKLAAIDGVYDHIVDSLREASGDPSVGDSTVLEDALPGDGHLEAYLTEVESDLKTHLSDEQLKAIFAGHWRVRDLVRALSSQVKVAASNDQSRRMAHQRYMSNKGMHQSRAKAYRMTHMSQLRRKSRAYRKKIKRNIIRPKKRVGSSAGGYSFIVR